MNLKERVIQYLIDNQGYIKLILEPHTKTKNKFLTDEPVFHDEIYKDYNDLVHFVMINEVCKGLSEVNYVDVMSVIEDINLSDYLAV